jgi:hypothetical protein
MSLIKKKKYQYLYLIEKLWHQNREAMHYQDLGWFDHPDLEDKELKRWEKNFDWLKRLNSKYKYNKER